MKFRKSVRQKGQQKGQGKWKQFRKEKDGTFTVGAYKGVPNIRAKEITEFLPEGAFLGPNAENREMFNNLITQAINNIWMYRASYQLGDDDLITPEIKNSPAYQQTVLDMQTVYNELLQFMDAYATPFFSPRYQAHMLGENPLASMIGYFSSMLHNPNNVTIEAATSTVPLEMLVGDDLCKMIGYMGEGEIQPFCHLNSGGSLCVIEALWSSRELKHFPLAVRKALRKSVEGSPEYDPEYKPLNAAYNVTVQPCNPVQDPVQLMQTDDWTLFNIVQDETMALPKRIYDMCANAGESIDENIVWDLVNRLGMNQLGWVDFEKGEGYVGTVGQPVFVVPSTKHYSWPKGGAVLGYGKDQVKNVFVDKDARINVTQLEATLEQCLADQIPVTSVTSVFGSTEESSVDDLQTVLEIRDRLRGRGMDFQVFVDAAWGGYLTAIVREHYTLDPLPTPPAKMTSTEGIFITDTTNVPLSDRTIDQIRNIYRSDAVIIDPHKYGYIQYPAGALLYRNENVKNLTLGSASYIGMDIPPVGICGIEGSRPGAAAAAVFTAHRCINPSITGYGKILTNSMFNAKKFYVHMLLMESETFKTTPLNRLPSERAGADDDTVQGEIQFIKDNIWNKTNQEIMNNPDAMALFKDLGPDQNIVDFGYNFMENGLPNTDIGRYNQLNEEIYKAFSVEFDNGPEPVQKYPFLVSRTMFKPGDYGDQFIQEFAERNGLDYSTLPPEGMFCFRSTVTDPLDSDRTDSLYYQPLMEVILAQIEEIVAQFPQTSREKSRLEE